MYVGIDIGGTRCRILAVDSLGDIKQRGRYEFLLSHNFDADLTELIRGIHRFVLKNSIEAIGLSVPGDLNPDKTLFADPSDNLTEWSDKPVKALLAQEFQCPVFMENDGAAAALGEAVFGKQADDFYFIAWGTGVGGAFVTRENGVITSRTLNWYDYFDAWEQDCGGNAIYERYEKHGHELDGDEWEDVMEKFQAHLHTFIEATQAAKVIFGGGIAIKQTRRILALRGKFKRTKLLIAALGEDAGLYGSLALLKSSQP